MLQEKMNIGFIYGQKTYPPTSGGSIHGYQLAKNLSELGHTLRSFFFGEDQHPYITHYRARSILRFLWNIDVLYLRAEWNGGPERLAAIKFLAPRRIPVIIEFNGTPNETLYSGKTSTDIRTIEARLRRLARITDGAVAVSDEIRAYLVDEIGFRNIVSIPNGGDPDTFRPASNPNIARSAPLIVAWVGTTSAPWQDLDSLFNAAEILQRSNENIKFWVFGDENKLPKKIPANIIKKGVIPYNILSDTLNQANVGIHIFKKDTEHSVHGSPLKIFDYMACGLAIVTQFEGQRGQIVGKYGAGVSTTGTPDDIARTLLALERNRQQCYEMGRSARLAIEANYNWKNTARQVCDFVRQLA